MITLETKIDKDAPNFEAAKGCTFTDLHSAKEPKPLPESLAVTSQPYLKAHRMISRWGMTVHRIWCSEEEELYHSRLPPPPMPTVPRRRSILETSSVLPYYELQTHRINGLS
ncbi:hypothetical protein HAX54_032569 [Datura stramonium]|uniref:Uncharacterized protein n=1 Tax=Datura stramonium TaxID=4076 RepID=A0ABS8VDD1_DATST|nr:hypothetical protein [Datura stramonium]